MTIHWNEAKCVERGVDYAKLKSAESRLRSLIDQVLEPSGLRLSCRHGCLLIDHVDYPHVDGKGQVHESYLLAEVASDCLRDD